MSTLYNIEQDVRFYTNQSDLSLITAAHLRVVNEALHEFAKLRRFPEFTREHTFTATACVSAYTFPTAAVFVDEEYRVDLLDVSDSQYPYPLHPSKDEDEWAAMDSAGAEDIAAHRVFRVLNNAGTIELRVRPMPDTTGDIFHFIGLVQPVEFTTISSSASFRTALTDKAFAHWVAAKFCRKRELYDLANYNEQAALALLPKEDTAPRIRSGMLKPYRT